VVERGCRHLDIIAGAKERLLDAAGLAAEIRPRMSFVSSKRIWRFQLCRTTEIGRMVAVPSVLPLETGMQIEVHYVWPI
jgi:hypothetical protein